MGPDRVIRLSTVGALVLALWLPVSGLVDVALFDTGHWVAAAAGMVAMGLLHGRHVWFAVRGLRPPAAAWTLTALALVVAALVPSVYAVWGRPAQMLLASLVILLPAAWAFAAVLVLGTTTLVSGLATGWADWLPSVLLGYLAYGVASGLLIHLVVALRRLRASRTELAQGAVVRERLRIDTQLRATVGVALAELVERGERADAAGAPEALQAELAGIAAAARRTLGVVRRAVRGYQQASLQVELDAAVTLLAAGGIEATVIGADTPVAFDDDMRAALRTGIAGLLRGGRSTTHCVIEVVGGARPRLRLTPESAAR